VANDRIDIDLDVNTRGVSKSFKTLESKSKVSAGKVSQTFSRGLDLSFRRFIAGATTRLLGLGAAVASLAGLGSLLNNIKDLDRAFTEIKTIIPDVTQANEELRQSLIATSSEFGTSAVEQARSFYSIVSAGITDAVEANKVLIASNKLAIGGLTTVEQAVDILTTTINAYGSENITAANASDILFGTVKLGKTRVDELASSLGLILPTASALGVSFEDVSAAVAALTTKGISTSQAVTQLSSVFTAVLKKQDEAKKIGPEVAKAFTLQALQAKGLTKFLFDLNFELGGSERALTKLLGRAEGAKAILALASDGFKTLGNNVADLKNSTGAAEEAFQKVNNTIGQQLNILGSTISNIFTNISESSNESIVGFVKNLVKLAQSISSNLGAIASALKTATKLFLSYIIAIKLAPKLIAATRISFKLFRTEIGLIPTRIGLAKLSIQQFKFSLKSISFTGAINGLRRLRTGLKTTRIAMAAARVGVNLFKGALTLGLSFAIDFLIVKFFELKKAFGGFGNLVEFTVLTIRKSFNDLILSSIRLGQTMSKLPGIGEAFQTSFGGELALAESNSVIALKGIEDEFDNLAQKVFDATTDIDFGPMREKFKELKDELKIDLSFDEDAFNENRRKIEEGLDGIGKKAEEMSKKITDAVRNGLGNALASGVEKAVGALLKGENAFQAFANGVLGVFGDLAIQLGKFFIIQGIAIDALNAVSGTGAIVAGVALIALGTILKSFSGGAGASASGGGSAVTPPLADLEPGGSVAPEFRDDGARVQVTIEGNVFDSEETGTRIADILKEQGFNNAVIS
jgi:TP901 family phage tail tape measure protein